ncbi:MAG: 4-alpha-glucanotransferase [Deltaproteobacteria bacterium]|nr:MAG: 4-alpha-glucanotransferase [Deltaproteobacteria bacterium]
MKRRGSGILLHITSLPSFYGIGDLGPSAYQFVDFLSETKQSFWQILPLKPTSTAHGNSPYSSFSAFAGNTLLISPERLVEEGLLSKADIKDHPSFPDETVIYKTVTEYKTELFRAAYGNFKKRRQKDYGFVEFCNENRYWLDDYVLFVTLKESFGGAVWSEWPEDIRDRKGEIRKELKGKLKDKIEMGKFLQYVFYKQWHSLRAYCNSKDIQIIGDIPIYVNYDSADVWANPRIFKLDENRRPTFMAGVPPDYFSSTGQLWGNPVYNWDFLRETEYAWWIRLIEHNLKLFNIIRLDHFRGLVAYWEVPAGEETAINGRWVEVPARDFFDKLLKRFSSLPIIAEDLGIITPDVKEIVDLYGFPGMKLLLFAFGDDVATNPYVPHNHVKNCVVYTGTHDNNTAKGWFRKEARPEDKRRLFQYLGRKVTEETVRQEFVRMAMMSVADLVIIPMQDILGLGEEARMNTPSTANGNWEWRLLPGQLTPSVAGELSEVTKIYGRA